MTSTIVCDVCPRACRLEEGGAGLCGVRANINGENKDRLYRYLDPTPRYMTCGSDSVYVAWLPLCNLKCPFCGVPQISQTTRDLNYYEKLTEANFVEEARAWNVGVVRIFGGEPAIHYEYVLELASLARQRGVSTAIETNAYINPWIAEKIGRAVDRVSVGIKGSASPTFYARMDADPQHILDAVRVLWAIHPEMTILNLISPRFNITTEDHKKLAAWVRENLSVNVRFEIDHERLLAPFFGIGGTAAGDVEKAWRFGHEIAKVYVEDGLENVWLEDPRILRPGPWQWVHVK